MAESIILEGKEYVSARRASEETGYARDYIGQLARKGLIGAQRVGGLWYVSLESLKGYQANAESYTPTLPPVQQGNDPDAIVSFDGKDYISASRAAKLSGYNQDYVGQLARAGKILSRQVGNRWYVEKDGLLSHKAQKDSLLAAVQRESVGLSSVPRQNAIQAAQTAYTPYYSYVSEKGKDLMPALPDTSVPAVSRISRISTIQAPILAPSRNVIDMRATAGAAERKVTGRSSGKTMRRAIKIGSALTFVIVLSYGLSTLKTSSHYTLNDTRLGGMIDQTASAIQSIQALDTVAAYIESLVARDIIYTRGQ
jgi:hypothetical protein